MHELSLCQSLVEIVVDHAKRGGIGHVTDVRATIGALSCVDPDALAFCFDVVARDTPAAEATLTLTVVPVEAWCWTCAAVVEVCERGGGCPACGNATVRATDLGDLQVTEIIGQEA